MTEDKLVLRRSGYWPWTREVAAEPRRICV